MTQEQMKYVSGLKKKIREQDQQLDQLAAYISHLSLQKGALALELQTMIDRQVNNDR